MPLALAVVLLGVIEGLTEFIPVSSTGHLLIAEHYLPRQTDLFNIVIQCGAVVAVLPLFSGRLKQLLFELRTPAARDYLLKLTTSFGITGVGGLLLERADFKLPETLVPVASALIVGGVIMVLVERWLSGRAVHDRLTWGVAVAVGLGQLLAAVFPGASRSASTIVPALLLGVGRPLATEFSFLVGVPTILAAGGLKLLKALRHDAGAEDWSMVLLGTASAAIVSFIAVKWFLRFVRSHTFTSFGIYRIVLGVALLLALR